MPGHTERALIFTLLLVIAVQAVPCSGQRIRSLLTGQVDKDSNPLLKWFGEEPLVEGLFVPTRPGGLVEIEDIKRFVRIYFPRTRAEVGSYDFIMLHSPVMYHFGENHAIWMREVIGEGSGCLSSPSCMSVDPDINGAWIGSVLSQVVPNDCPAVMNAGGPLGENYFQVRVNRDFPEPVLTPFIPLGVENFVGYKAYRIIPREGAVALAWNVGSFESDVPYMATWDFDKGRVMTLGDSFGLQFWSDYAHGYTQNKYGLDILMNMVLYLTRREVPDEVLILHQMRLLFVNFRTNMDLLLTVADFAREFGANDRGIELLMEDLEEGYLKARGLYLSNQFDESRDLMNSILVDLGKAEGEVMRLKDRAMFWIYLVEWLVITATLMISSSVLWTLLVNRSLYRDVGTTRNI